MNGNFINRLMWGLLIIVVGVGLLLRQGGYADFDIGAIFSVYWPVILMFLGVQGLLQRMAYGRGSAFGSGVLLVLGFLFLGRNLDLFVWSVGDMIKFAGPLILIVFGISMIFKPKAKKRGDEAKDKWKDDWQAYNYGPTEEPPAPPQAPPPPPLHPDPTKASFDFGDGGADGMEAPSGQGGEQAQGPRQSAPERAQDPRQGPHQGQGPYQGPRRERPEGEAGGGVPPYGQGFPNHPHHHKRMSHAERHAIHAAKVRERIERRHYQRYQRHLQRKDRVEWWNHDPNVQTRSGFIGDIYLGHDYWELKPMNISHFIGDTVLDLTKAQIVPGETVINISSFIGDVKVYLPNDYEFGVHVVSSAFVGDVAVLEQKEGGIFKNIDVETPYFQEMDKKIILHVSTFIGDVRVTKVG